jgi:nicotinate phosphoribosyltransferase
MAQAFWRQGMREPATFSLFFRGYPHERSHYAFAGLESALEFLEGFRFSGNDIQYLKSTGIFDPEFLEFLSDVRFTGSVRAMPEGSLAFADEPVVEVTAQIIEAQIVETFLLNQVAVQTTLLTKAARITQAAEGRQVFDFSARRTHGGEAADLAARCAAIGGFAGTSNVRAAARYGLTPVGTMAHSFVQAFGEEMQAFRAYAEEFPDSTTLLVDTFDAIAGVRNAITVAKELETSGHRLRGVRIDSGDIAALAKQARAALDQAGLGYVKITATGDLDEHRIAELIAAGAPVDSFGIGTRFGVSEDAPVSSAVYKLARYGGSLTAKLSPGKSTFPGPKQVYRFSIGGWLTGDIIAAADEAPPEDGAPLLETVMEHGERTAPAESWQQARDRLSAQLGTLPQRNRRLAGQVGYPVSVSDRLLELRRREEARRR